MEKQDQNMENKLYGLKADLISVKENFKQSLQTLQEDVAILKKAVLQGSP